MAIFYKSNSTNYRVRSISLPASSHPSVQKTEIELNDIKTSVLSSSKASIEAVCDGLLKLSRLYDHKVIDLLSLINNEKLVVELMERLVGFLDICGIVKDIVSQMDGHVRELECASRTRKGDSSIENSITRYYCFRKKIKKDVKRLLASLKQSMATMSRNYQEVAMIKMIMEVTFSLFESLLMLFVTPKTNKWCKVLIQRKRVACEEQNSRQTYDFEGLDVVLQNRCIKDGFSSWLYATCRWETMEAQIQRLEDSLECIFRSLIRTRAHLLNIVSNN